MIDSHVDKERTKLLRKLKLFVDPKSYISIAGHIYLRGDDRAEQRERLIRLQGLRCALCGEPVGAWEADMDHVHGGHKHARCDCLNTKLADGSRHTNIQIVHGMFSRRGCHRKKHNREIKWSRLRSDQSVLTNS